MTLARALRLLLAIALLAVWQGALLHPLQHIDSQGGFVHAASVHGHDSQGHGEDGSGRNALCDAIAALTACIGDAPGVAFSVKQGLAPLSALQRTAPPGAVLPPYRSQAPPALL